MNTMYTLASQDAFPCWMDQSFHRASNYRMASFQSLIDDFQLRVRVGRNRLEVVDWSFPFLTPFDSERIVSEFEPYYWVEYSGDTSVVATSVRVPSPESVEEWHRWRWLTEFRLARWREIFAGVKLNVRLGTLVWQLLLKTLCRPLFADHLSRKEYLWMLLHGAHPPRQDAGIFPTCIRTVAGGYAVRINSTTP